MGTDDGLNRFDGYEFKVFRNDPVDSLSLPDNYILTLAKDEKENIWIGTRYGGLCRKDRKGKFIRYPELRDQTINVLFDDRLLLWVGTDRGLCTLEKSSGKILSHQLTSRKIYAIHRDSREVTWIGTDDGIIRIGDPENIQTEIISLPLKKQLPVHSVNEDSHGDLWFGVEGGFIFLDHETAKTIFYGDESGITQMRGYWAPSDSVFTIFTLGTGAYHVKVTIDKDNNYVPGMPEKIVTGGLPGASNVACFLQTDDGHLWLGTDGGGLGKIFIPDISPARTTGFQKIMPDSAGGNGLTYHDIGSLRQSQDNELWVALWGNGINRFSYRDVNSCQRIFQRLHHDEFPAGSQHHWKSQDLICITEDNAGNMWLGSETGGLYRWDKAHQTFSQFAKGAPPEGLSDNTINAVLFDGSHRIFIGTTKGLDILDTEKMTISQRSVNGQPLAITTLYKDEKLFLLGTTNGEVYQIKESRDTINFELLIRQKLHPVLCIYRQNDKLWIGTEGGGLFRWSLTDRSGFAFTSTMGLPNNVVYGILEDKRGDLWMSTNNGLTQFDPELKTFRNFFEKNGLPDNEFNRRAFYKGSDNWMYFGGINGIVFFNPDCLQPFEYKPPVVITGIDIMNHPVDMSDDELILKPDEKIVTFQYAALSFRQPEKNQYAYRLEGFDDNWTYTDGRKRSVTYTNLDPGQYVFTVKASNEDGIWNQVGATLIIQVKPPWWNTWWAVTFYFLAISVIATLVWRTRLARERLRFQLKAERLELEKAQEIDRIKSRLFANISHEFRTPLTLIIGQADTLISQSVNHHQELQSIRVNSNSLLHLVNEVLDLSRLDADVFKLNVSNFRITEFLKVHVALFQSSARQKSLSFTVEYPPDDTDVYVDPSVLKKIINNLLSNAIKFTPSGGAISFRADLQGHQLEIKVADSGIGIDEEHLDKIFERFYRISEATQGTGIGLTLTRELVRLHGGEIYIESKKGCGTTFKVIISQMKEACLQTGYELEDSLAGDPVTYASVTAAPGDAMTSFGLPVLLIVEDNQELRNFMVQHLCKHFEVIEAAHGGEGWEKAQSCVPEIILSDWMMPGLSGQELCGKIKTTEITSHIPVILLTARADTQSKLEGLETGADDYLLKPFDMRELKTKLRNLVERQKKLREKYAREGLLQYKSVNAKSRDEKFINRLYVVIEQNLGNSQLQVEWLSRELGISRVQLHRKLIALTGLSASDLIRDYRLQRAADLLRQKSGNVSEIAYEVGFESLSYFAKAFRQKFHVNPSEYINR